MRYIYTTTNVFTLYRQPHTFFTILLQVLLVCCASAQTTSVDSLRPLYYGTHLPADRLKHLIGLLNNYESLHTDTILLYRQQARQLLKNNNDPVLNAELTIVDIRLLKRQGKYADALAYCDSALLANPYDKGNQAITRKLVSSKSGLLITQLRYKDALDLTFGLLKQAEAAGDDITVNHEMMSIGWVYMEMAKNREALEWFFKALNLSEKMGYTDKNATTYANIAAVYNELNQNDSAELYIQKAIRHTFLYNNLTVAANCYYILSDIMVDKGNLAAAEIAMNKGVEIRRRIGDPFYVVSDLTQLGIFYATNGQPQKGIAVCKEGIDIARKSGLTSKLLILYEALAKNYKASGHNQQYGETLETILSLKDSLYKNNSAEALAELQTKYEVQKKENENIRQSNEIVRKNYVIYGSAILFILLILLALTNFRSYRKKQQLKMQLVLHEEKKRGELAIRDAEEKERTRIAADLHDNIGVQASAILYGTELLKVEQSQENQVVDNLHDTAREMLVNLRETLWAMKNTDIAAADLWLRVINFCKQMGRHYTHLKIEVAGAAPAKWMLSSIKALHLMMIIQEAVNNAAKHSKGSTIAITSKPADENWQITIQDDGAGFDLIAASSNLDGNGLGNMQDRAQAAGIQFNIESAASRGTSILLSIVQEA